MLLLTAVPAAISLDTICSKTKHAEETATIPIEYPDCGSPLVKTVAQKDRTLFGQTNLVYHAWCRECGYTKDYIGNLELNNIGVGTLDEFLRVLVGEVRSLLRRI